MPKPKNGLTPKQQAFVNEYLIDLNASQAALRAGYSKKTANRIGQENLQKPVIQAFLKEKLREREQRTEITADNVIKELAKVAFSDLKAVMNWDEEGVITMRPMEEVDGRLLQSITQTENETEYQTTRRLQVKLHDKMKALELLGKHFGIFTEKFDIQGQMGVTIVDDIPDEEDDGE